MSKIFRRFTAGIVALSLLIVSLPLAVADTDTASVDSTIALASGWNVFSTPRVLESINFSNEGAGVSFYKMEGGEWNNTTTSATITNIQPLEGFLVNNTSGDTVYVYLDYEDSNPGEKLFTKTLDVGWNIVGVADLSFEANDEDYTEISVKNAFSSIKDQPSNIIDYTTDNFTGNDNSNEIDSSCQRYSTPETDTEKFEEFKAYPVFIRQCVAYSGSSTNKSDSPSPPPAEINGSLTVTKSSTSVSDTAVKGTQDVSLIGLTMAAGADSDMKITEMVVRLYADDDDVSSFAPSAGGIGEGDTSANNLVSNIELWVGDTKIAGPEGMTLVGTIDQAGYYKATFDNMSYAISAGETIQVVVKGDISSNIPAVRYLAADIDPDNDITCEDINGDSVTAAGIYSLNNSASPNPVITISTGGSLTVAVDADTAKEDIVVAGTSDVEISKFKFTTTDEAFLVKKLSINNRQSGVAAANIGDYDDNVIDVTLSYTNSGGTTETKTGYLTSGTANFSGLDMLIDKDDDAVLTVSATLNTIAAGADAATFVDLDIAFNDFEAIAQGSGETYKGDKIDATVVAAGAYLDFGTISYTATGAAANNATTVVTLGSSATVTVADQGVSLPVGTIILVDNDGTYDATNSTVLILTTKYTDDDTTLTALVVDNADTTPGTDNVYYALPGTGYLTNSNHMHVYETKPTITLSASSPSGSRTVASADGAFIFTISADAQEKVQFQTAQMNDCTEESTTFPAADLAGAFTAGAGNLTDPDTGGIGNSAYQRNTTTGINGTIIYTFTTSDRDLSAYEGISFWARNTDAEALVLTLDDDAGTDPSVTVTPTLATWTFVDYPFTAAVKGTANANIDAIDTITLSAAGSANTDTIDLDRVVLYTEKIVIDIASDADIDTSTTGNADNLVAYLKEGGSTIATGYIYSATQATDASSATIHFYPIEGTDSTIEISKGTSKTFTLQIDSSSLLEEDSGSDDPVTISMALGSSSAGTVTPGGIWWNETNANVQWLGQVDDATLYGNTLKY